MKYSNAETAAHMRSQTPSPITRKTAVSFTNYLHAGNGRHTTQSFIASRGFAMINELCGLYDMATFTDGTVGFRVRRPITPKA